MTVIKLLFSEASDATKPLVKYLYFRCSSPKLTCYPPLLFLFEDSIGEDDLAQEEHIAIPPPVHVYQDEKTIKNFHIQILYYIVHHTTQILTSLPVRSSIFLHSISHPLIIRA